LPARKDIEHLGLLHGDGLHDVLISAASIHDAEPQEQGAYDHDDAADGIGDRYTTKTSDDGIDGSGCGDKDETNAVFIVRYCYEYLCGSDELRNDKCSEEDYKRTGKDECKNVRAKTRIDDVDNRDSMDAACDECELLAHHAEEQDKRNDLRPRQIDPSKAVFPSLTRHTYEGSDGAERGDRGHDEHDRTESTTGHEVFSFEVFFRRVFPNKEGNDKANEKEDKKRDQR